MPPGLRATEDLIAGMAASHARWLVDYYYSIQDFRIQAQGQLRAIEQGADEGTFQIGDQLLDDTFSIEKQIKKALDKYTDTLVPGQWAKSIYGIGPVLAAGLAAHIDIEKAPTVGHIWRFAGYDPTQKWLGKTKATALVAEVMDGSKVPTQAHVFEVASRLKLDPQRFWTLASTGKDRKKLKQPTRNSLIAAAAKRPWNASLKVLCWKISDSFVKMSGREDDVYGKVYRARKELEVVRNEAGLFAKLAEETLAERKFRDADVRRVYESGRLPDGRIDLRARRYAVKLFLAHYHHVAYEDHFGKPPPKPYVLEHLGHAHYLAPPNWPMKKQTKKQKKQQKRAA